MISVVMATYNGARYLEEQLDSVLRQSFSDFELIICDDCSTDDTINILKAYAIKDHRIRYYRNSKNIGFKKNFEHAITMCRGEYIALCDQDDIWYSNHLEILYGQIADYSISCANSELVDSQNKVIGKRLNEVEGLYSLPSEPSKLLYKILLAGNPFQGASMLFPSAFLKKCTPIPEGILFHDAWFAACACLQSGIKYSFTPITRYRQHGDNVTYSANRVTKRKASYYMQKTWEVIRHKTPLFTDRYAYIEGLKNIFGTGNKDFDQIYHIIRHLQNKQLNIADVYTLWHNYSYISTRSSKRGFFKSMFVWTHWKDIEDPKENQK